MYIFIYILLRKSSDPSPKVWNRAQLGLGPNGPPATNGPMGLNLPWAKLGQWVYSCNTFVSDTALSDVFRPKCYRRGHEIIS